MKKVILVLALILTGGFFASAQTPEKKTTEKSKSQVVEREKFDPARDAARDLQAAIAKAQTEGKRIILDVGGEWCGWCRLMDNYFINNSALAKLRDENFVWLKINFSEENENKEFLAAYPAVKGYPHLFVLEKDGKFLCSQNTEELEEPKSYNLQKFTDFLNLWSLPKTSVK